MNEYTPEKDGQLAGDAVEIKRRAERRLGELMDEIRKAGKLAKGATEPGTKRGTTRVSKKPASLGDHGIDKNLADRARKAAAMPARQFEAEVAKAKSRAVAAAEGCRIRTTQRQLRLSLGACRLDSDDRTGTLARALHSRTGSGAGGCLSHSISTTRRTNTRTGARLAQSQRELHCASLKSQRPGKYLSTKAANRASREA